MARVKIVGLKIKTLADGSTAYYFHPTPRMQEAGFSPEPLGREPGPAYARAQQLADEWKRIRRGETVEADEAPKGSFKWLAYRYQESAWFSRLADVTQVEAAHHIGIICESPIGGASVRRIERKHCRAFHDRRTHAASETHANRSVKWLRRVLSYGIEIGLIDTNPASGMGLRSGPPRRQQWTKDQIAAFKATAIAEGYPAWALAVQLAYDTSQRLSDLLRAPWTAYDGVGIEIRQQKTGAEVYAPLSPEAHRMLAETEKKAVVILAGVKGGSINRHYFNRMYRVIRAKAGLPAGLQFRDLRRTAISEAWNAGQDPTPISGHMPGSNVMKVYAVPDRKASARVQKARWKGKK